MAEIRLENGEITMREFVREIAKSEAFRKQYWTSLYVCKAIEYIHRRLLGRPTYGRQEMNAYFDLCAKKGFYALVDTLIDSPEYRCRETRPRAARAVKNSVISSRPMSARGPLE